MELDNNARSQEFNDAIIEDMYIHMNDETLERLYNENIDKYRQSEKVLLDIDMEMERRYGKTE